MSDTERIDRLEEARGDATQIRFSHQVP